MSRPSPGDAIRLGLGAACVATAVIVAAVYVPRTVKSMNDNVQVSSLIVNPTERILKTGDIQDIPSDLQFEALTLIPHDATYVVVLPTDQQAGAAKYGVPSFAYVSAQPWFQYLLLPAKPVAAGRAGFIICWGCNRAVWDTRTTWLWDNGSGEAIGRVQA